MTQQKTVMTTPTINEQLMYPTRSEMVEYVLDTFVKASALTIAKCDPTVTSRIELFNEVIGKNYNISTIFSAGSLALVTTEMLAIPEVHTYITDVMASFKLLLGNEFRYPDVVEWISTAYGIVEYRPENVLLHQSVPDHVREALYSTSTHVEKTLNSNSHIVYFVLLCLVS